MTKYLIDNNGLLDLGAKRTASAFFREHCRVPDEVAHEAGPRRAECLAPITLHMCARILFEVVAIMKTVPVGDRRLIDLYGNKGAADPILIATAIILNNPQKPDLFENEWEIVTNDRAVREKAQEFGINTRTPQQLAALIDSGMSG